MAARLVVHRALENLGWRNARVFKHASFFFIPPPETMSPLVLGDGIAHSVQLHQLISTC